MNRIALVALCALAITPVAIAQTQQRDESAEEGEMPSASASASATAPAPMRVRVFARSRMVFVTGGRFTFGSNDAKLAAPNEKPARDAVAKSFWIDRTEVTVGAYRACVRERKCAEPSRRSPSCTFELGDDALPINCVRFQDADTFCRAQNKRLPTEIEWELAARGGGWCEIPGNAAVSPCAATLPSRRKRTELHRKTPRTRGLVRDKTLSPFGALDMAGNVEEWTSDWYVEHPHRPPRTSSRRARVTSSAAADLDIAPRGLENLVTQVEALSKAGSNVGFRCARD